MTDGIPGWLATLLVGGGAFLGANGRYWLGLAMKKESHVIPWNTLTINVTGSLVIGLFMAFLLRSGWGAGWRLFMVVGVLGGYTTFSAFSFETFTLVEAGKWKEAAVYVLASNVAGILACSLAYLALKSPPPAS